MCFDHTLDLLQALNAFLVAQILKAQYEVVHGSNAHILQLLLDESLGLFCAHGDVRGQVSV